MADSIFSLSGGSYDGSISSTDNSGTDNSGTDGGSGLTSIFGDIIDNSGKILSGIAQIESASKGGIKYGATSLTPAKPATSIWLIVGAVVILLLMFMFISKK